MFVTSKKFQNLVESFEEFKKITHRNEKRYQNELYTITRTLSTFLRKKPKITKKLLMAYLINRGYHDITHVKSFYLDYEKDNGIMIKLRVYKENIRTEWSAIEYSEIHMSDYESFLKKYQKIKKFCTSNEDK